MVKRLILSLFLALLYCLVLIVASPFLAYGVACEVIDRRRDKMKEGGQ